MSDAAFSTPSKLALKEMTLSEEGVLFKKSTLRSLYMVES